MYGIKLNDLKIIFNKLDRDDDGHVSVGELSWLLDKVGVQYSPHELESIVGRQQRLDFQEFVLFWESICKKGEGEEKEIEEEENDLVEAFKVFDLNNDGFISCDELQSVLSRLGLWEERDGGDCKSMIHEFDTNSDGLLDFEEFKNMMLLKIS